MAAFLAMEEEAKCKESKDEDIYDAEAIHDKLEDFAWTEHQPWVETLTITSSAPTHIDSVDDDMERELAFYNQALEAAKVAIDKFEEAGIKWKRPADYYAEMVKSDEHMARVKEQLLHEQQVIQTAEQRRKEREAKKFGKQVAAERKKERDQEKKKAITSVAALRKKRQKDGYAGDLDMDAELAKLDGPKPFDQLGTRFDPSRQTKTVKRAKRDAKYGFGGPKRLKKQNDAYSSAGGDYKRSAQGGGSRGGGDGKFKKPKGKPQRPGKTRRAAMRKSRP